MIVNCNGTNYTLNDEDVYLFLDRLEAFTLSLYANFPEAFKIAGQAVTRGFLVFLEKQEKDKEKKAQYKPAKKSDPTIHLLHIIIGYIKEAITGVDTYVQTDEQNRVINATFQVTGKSRGHLSPDGNTGEREDNSRKNARQCTSEDLSIS